jgi:hypothetical protein
VKKVMLGTVLAAVAITLPGVTAMNAGGAVAARPAQAARTCQNIQLVVRPQNSQGAAGTIAIIYRIHNLYGRACTLYGYPGVRLLSRTFITLPTTVTRGGGFLGGIPKQPVMVPARGNAYFTLTYSDVPVNNGPCYTAPNVMIFAPGDYLPVVTYAYPHASIFACNGALNVSPVTSQPRYH